MLSLHYICHVVALVIIAVLFQNIMDLSSQLKDLKSVNITRLSQLAATVVKVDPKKPRAFTPRDSSNQPDSTTLQFTRPAVERFQSSVQCSSDHSHLCKLVNLCYHGNTEEFIMFQDADSVYENVDISDGAFKLDLSSISGHNVYQVTVLNIPSVYSSRFNITWVNATTLIYKPFLPGNIMHVFHDDILPLYHSMRLINPDFGFSNMNHHNIEIFSLDDLTDSDMLELYEMFSNSAVRYKQDFTVNVSYLKTGEGITCFKEAYVGLAKTTVWYDFGFTKQQGPVERPRATGNHIHSAVKYVWNQLNMESDVTEHFGNYLVLFTRKENRRILNEVELTLEIVKQIGIKVININFETHSLSEMIAAVTNSRGIVGMHGSMMILAIFLKPGSILVELFPYAVNPVNYTPYKTMAELPGMNIFYGHWANMNTKNTVGHPDWPEDVGGLGHLDPAQREVIINQAEVPPHLCCSDPSWLYHIYQDTIVDVSAVTSLVKETIDASDHIKAKTTNNIYVPPFYPSKVQNVKCNISNKSEKLSNGKSKKYFLYMQWTIPWTNFMLVDESVLYEILIQDLNDESESASSHKTSSTSLSVNIDKFGVYYVWVRCVVNQDYAGPYSDVVICDDDID